MQMMKIKTLWFDGEFLYVQDMDGKEFRQSLLWYPNLMAASDEERCQYVISDEGIHWRNIDEDVSFESFGYEDAEPTDFQRFFLTHKELNISELAKLAGINASLLRNYINGHKKPSEERKKQILRLIHKLSEEYAKAEWVLQSRMQSNKKETH